MQWIEEVCTYIGDALGLAWSTVAIILAAIIVVVLALIIIAIVVSAKKKKKRKAARAAKAAAAQPDEKTKAEESAPAVEPQPEPVKAEKKTGKEIEEPVKEETAKSEETAEEVKEVSAEKTEEKPAEKETAEKKPAAKKAATPKPAKEEKVKNGNGKAKVLGKWVVERKSEDEFISVLFASNGEAMLTSETYVSEDGAKKGIATIVKAVENGDFVTYRNKNGNYYFKLKSAANRLLCAGEIYKDRTGCENAVESVKRIAAESPVTEEVSDGEKYIEYKPVMLTESELQGAAKGKWKIENTEDGKFFATLYASNGQVMLSTEEVSAKTTALANIENVKKNALIGNFVIDKDKFGKFYYKLRNANKSVICVGESYTTSARCISAMESVRKFAANSPIAE